MGKPIDLTGKRFGRLIVVRFARKNKFGLLYWSCLCDCGEKRVVRGNDLRGGISKSCGCFQREQASNWTSKNKTRHGHSRKDKSSRTYGIWTDITKRCTNPNHKYYHRYGGRGIEVCDRWKKFEYFLEDMGEVPTNLQIDRIDNNLGYSPENCQWTTSKENNRNRCNNHLITFSGRTQCLSAWAEEIGMSHETLSKRISKLGWSVEKALMTPIRKRRKDG